MPSEQSGGAPALRPGARAQSPGREAALAWASLAQRFPASSVLAREGAGCGSAFFLFFYPFGPMACGILVPQPGIESEPLAVKEPSPNHWMAREVPKSILNARAF